MASLFSLLPSLGFLATANIIAAYYFKEARGQNASLYVTLYATTIAIAAGALVYGAVSKINIVVISSITQEIK
ncbi:MAG: hypothetical protein A3F91_09810 [Flavobacteria bacterium RIFCSPLOWO2_12_FULL_35_11]|nr:MAG: hypothetical protein A3F91_09810 [Flavobacteria bacterium RIFCSPLOWO2_12_FULL_35_11]